MNRRRALAQSAEPTLLDLGISAGVVLVLGGALFIYLASRLPE